MLISSVDGLRPRCKLDLVSQPPYWQMRLLALAPWVAALIASAGATKPESVEEAGTYIFLS